MKIVKTCEKCTYRVETDCTLKPPIVIPSGTGPRTIYPQVFEPEHITNTYMCEPIKRGDYYFPACSKFKEKNA